MSSKRIRQVMRYIIASLSLLLCLPQAFTLVSIAPGLANASGCSNNTITVNVSISSVSGVYGFQLDLIYNSTALEVINVSEGNFLSNNGLYTTYWLSPSLSTPGLIKDVVCVIEGTGGPNPASGVLARINFRPKSLASYPGTSSLVLAHVKLSDINAGFLDNSTQNGQLTLTACPSCSGNETRACGSSVGECSQGNQTCINSQWGSCIGSVEPVNEACGDSKDNDCDGSTDEGCGDGDGGGSGGGGSGGSLPSSSNYTSSAQENASQKDYSATSSQSAAQAQQANASTNPTSPGSGEDSGEAASSSEQLAQEAEKAGSQGKFKPSGKTLFLVLVVVVLGLTFAGVIYFEKKKKANASEESKDIAPENIFQKEPVGSDQPVVDNAKSSYYTLNEYIRKAINAGATKQDIRKALLSKGWPEEIVDKVLESQDMHFS